MLSCFSRSTRSSLSLSSSSSQCTPTLSARKHSSSLPPWRRNLWVIEFTWLTLLSRSSISSHWKTCKRRLTILESQETASTQHLSLKTWTVALTRTKWKEMARTTPSQQLLQLFKCLTSTPLGCFGALSATLCQSISLTWTLTTSRLRGLPTLRSKCKRLTTFWDPTLSSPFPFLPKSAALWISFQMMTLQFSCSANGERPSRFPSPMG